MKIHFLVLSIVSFHTFAAENHELPRDLSPSSIRESARMTSDQPNVREISRAQLGFLQNLQKSDPSTAKSIGKLIKLDYLHLRGAYYKEKMENANHFGGTHLVGGAVLVYTSLAGGATSLGAPAGMFGPIGFIAGEAVGATLVTLLEWAHCGEILYKGTSAEKAMKEEVKLLRETEALFKAMTAAERMRLIDAEKVLLRMSGNTFDDLPKNLPSYGLMTMILHKSS